MASGTDEQPPKTATAINITPKAVCWFLNNRSFDDFLSVAIVYKSPSSAYFKLITIIPI
jgi:hypothetical protein